MVSHPRLLRLTEIIALLSCAASLARLISTQFLAPQAQSVASVAAITLFTLVLCIVHAGASKGWRKALGFTALSFVLSWLVEFIGCNYGWWFGDYGYESTLGLAIGNVPVLVVLSWEIIIYPSLLLVDHFTKSDRGSNRLLQITLASLATALVATAWDTMTDPLAVHLNYWTWDFGGAYMREHAGGIPLSNFWGWIGAIFGISFLYRLLFTRDEAAAAPQASSLAFATFLYSSLFLGNLAALIENQLFAPAFVGLFAMGPIVAMAWARLLSQRLDAQAVPAAAYAAE